MLNASGGIGEPGVAIVTFVGAITGVRVHVPRQLRSLAKTFVTDSTR